MRRRIVSLIAVVATVLTLGATSSLVGRPAADAATTSSVSALQSVSAVQSALNSGVSAAAQRGITTYAAVLDRTTGTVLARTSNGGTQVASESLVKMFLAAYYLVQYKGKLPALLDQRLRYMIKYSDDGTASALWTNAAVPLVRDRYGLTGVALATPNPGYWGRTRITADAVARFLYLAGKDSTVGPWLRSAMVATADNGSDGYNQNFGFNAIAGDGSKQGWGHDNWVNGSSAIHSAGFGARYVAAVLQSGGSAAYSVMPGTATATARNIDTAVNKLAKTTRVTVSATATVALANRPITVRAHVTNALGTPIAGFKVRFYARTETGAWTYRRVLMSDSAGNAAYSTSSGLQGYAYKAVVPGGSGYSSSESTAVVVSVKRAVSMSSLPAVAARNAVLIMRGTTGTWYVGRIVRAMHLTAGGWVSDGATIVEKDGSYQIYFRTATGPATRQYRAVIPAKSGSFQAATESLIRSIVVR